MSNKNEIVPTADYWRECEERARARAAAMRDPDDKAAMLKVAAIYKRMADQAARREKQPN